jgi:hypothetical protein
MSESPTVTLRVIRVSVPGQPDGWLLPIENEEFAAIRSNYLPSPLKESL